MTSAGTQADTFAKLLNDQAAKRGDVMVIREKRRGIWQGTTWREMVDQSRALAASLSGMGLGRGDHVALIGENRPGLFVAMAAAHQVGAVAVPMFSDATSTEIALKIAVCGAKVVFAENQEQVDKVLRILPRCPTIKAIVFNDDRGMRHYTQTALFDYRRLVDEGGNAGQAAQAPMASADDPAFVFFTSGTSGAEKAVVFSHRAMIAGARGLAAADGLTASDVTLAFLPPGWMCQTQFTYGLAMVAGQCICCPESPDTLMEDLREIAPTTLLTTPRMLDAILSQVTFRMEDTGGVSLALYRRAISHAQRLAQRQLAGVEPGPGDRIVTALFDLLVGGPLRDTLGMSRVRSAYSTGDALDPAMLKMFRALGINLKQLYGSTETGFQVAMQRDGAVRPETVGTPLEGVELSFSPDREILVRSPGQMTRYLNGAAASVVNDSGWIATGDAGHLDDRGQLHVEGRIDSFGRLTTGAALAPRLLESRIRVSPHVREAVVIGDGHASVCALIDIDTLAVGKWADGHEIPYFGHSDLASQEKVYALIGGWISEVNESLAADPALAALQIGRFVLLPEALSAEDGLLTLTGKLRRAVVLDRFAALIGALYAGEREAAPQAAAPRDQRDDAGLMGLKIRDARVVGAAVGRRAA